MSLSRRLATGFVLFVLVFSWLSVGFVVLPQPASADSSNSSAGCDPPNIGFGRWRWCGFYNNRFDDDGNPVRVGGVPGSVNYASEFINLIRSDLNSSNAHRRTGAQFVVHTMIGRAPGQPKTVTAAQLAEWERRVNTYANLSQNGSISTGTNGRIEWFQRRHTPCGIVNTYWQARHNDIAPFFDHAGNSRCEESNYRTDFILFRNRDGREVYLIRRECMNPMGNIDPLEDDPAPSFNLFPNINPTINGDAGNVAQPGDQVIFRYSVNNSGATASSGTVCNIYGNNRTGYVPTPSPPTSSSSPGYAPPPMNCPGTMPRGNTSVATETFTVSPAQGNSTICRSLFVRPATFNGGPRGTEVCITVANKPYAKFFGGDVSVGGGLETAPGDCSTTRNPNGAIAAWNRRNLAGYAGAGVQYAALAYSTITDFATAQGVGGATAPTGLAFGNQGTDPTNGLFGGSLGAAQCIPNYYALRPATTSTVPANVSSMNPGPGEVYGANSSITLGGGQINPGERITIFVNGNVYINGNIRYDGNWPAHRIPLFQIVARGNIYIDNDVTELDGVYIAQRNGANTGQIHTCSLTSTPITLDGSLHDNCDTKLTVNGAFVADRILLLRTLGSVAQSNPGEGRGAPPIAEVFNYNPALWIAQPLITNGEEQGYDSIISLPPVL